jgi:predicted  nucleic acid-binding Zn-ribbon protein
MSKPSWAEHYHQELAKMDKYSMGLYSTLIMHLEETEKECRQASLEKKLWDAKKAELLNSKESPEIRQMKAKLDTLEKEVNQNMSHKTGSQKEIITLNSSVAEIEKKSYEAILKSKNIDKSITEKESEIAANEEMLRSLNRKKIDLNIRIANMKESIANAVNTIAECKAKVSTTEEYALN